MVSLESLEIPLPFKIIEYPFVLKTFIEQQIPYHLIALQHDKPPTSPRKNYAINSNIGWLSQVINLAILQYIVAVYKS